MNYSIPENLNDYLLLLKKIEMNLNKENASEYSKILDDIYCVKPVKLKWFLLKAYALKLMNEDTTEIHDKLMRKYQLLYEDEKLNDIAVCLSFIDDNPLEKERLLYHVAKKNISDKFEYSDYIYNQMTEYNLICEKYLESGSSEKLLSILCDNCYRRNDFINCVIASVLLKKKFNKDYPVPQWVIRLPNIEMLIERLNYDISKNYIVVGTDDDYFYGKVISMMLSELGNNVYYIDKSNIVDGENIDVSLSIKVSMDNIGHNGAVHLVYPVKINRTDEYSKDNIPEIIQFINDELLDDNYSIVFSNGWVADSVCSVLKKSMERLSLFRADYFEENLNFSWSGDYLSHISELYGFDVHKVINEEAECDFSIVIPVRNSVDTFQYTLKTCLDQRYTGSYEIVVSDNSTQGNNCVKKFIETIDDPRVKYYRTPRDLPLTKSFEFAFLMAKGNFIFSIGADDGVLPWALDVLAECLKTFPDDDILLWERGFYAWPGFNGGQQNQFTVLLDTHEPIVVDRVESDVFLRSLAEEINYMYSLPLLYINSGFRKRYLNTLLKKTGRLWNGINQDISTGIINILINKTVLKISLALTIAGMSGSSIGSTSNKHPIFRFEGVHSTLNLTNYSLPERILFSLDGESTCIYYGSLKAMSYGIASDEVIEHLIMYKSHLFDRVTELSKGNEYYDEYIMLFDQASKKLNCQSVFNALYENLFSSIEIIKKEDDIVNACFNRLYMIGFNNGSLTLDASDFNVYNIQEAVELYEKITGF